jgi:hypothetical protein
MPSFLLAAMVVFMTSSGCPRVVTSNKFKPAPSSKLLNLTGFFSRWAGAAMGEPVTEDIVVVGDGLLSNGYVAGPRQEGGFVACGWREMEVYGLGGRAVVIVGMRERGWQALDG